MGFTDNETLMIKFETDGDSQYKKQFYKAVVSAIEEFLEEDFTSNIMNISTHPTFDIDY